MKTNNTLIKSAFILFCTLLIISCNKNDRILHPEISIIQKLGQPLPAIQIVSPHNPENPFDSVGIWHNEILGYIHSRSNKNLSEPEIAQLITDFALEHWGYNDMNIKVPTTDWQEHEGLESLQEEIVQQSNLTRQGKNHLDRLLTTIAVQGMRGHDFSYVELRDKIVSMEQQWINDMSLPVNDTNLLQMAASVGRHSAFYWTIGGTALPVESFPDEESNPGSTDRIMFKNVVRFIATVQWDMGGFVSGYIGGGLKNAAGEAAGSSGWIHDFFDYGVPGGW